MRIGLRTLAAAAALALVGGCSTMQTSGLQTTEHRVAITATAPSIKGQRAELYVREVKPTGAGKLSVVVFVHGAGTPAEVSFDSRMEDYSWLKQVARAGFDVFSVSLTGYGRSTRPPQMNDRCNIIKAQQAPYVTAACEPSYPLPIATSTSDWNDIDATVEYVKRLRGVSRVSLVGWSQGGPRITGFTLLHPDEVERIAVLAPAYNVGGLPSEPSTLPHLPNGSMTVQSRKDFIANWDRQVGCQGQYDASAAARIFDEMLESDPVGATWGTGVRRAPTVPIWGFDKAAVAKVRTPFLMFTGATDKQVLPQHVHELYADLGSAQKVIVDLACSSHNAMWEKNRKLLFNATVSWLRDGKVNGIDRGELRMGD
jgi:pimeloyl-ACP methyl ester carboxylesterase